MRKEVYVVGSIAVLLVGGTVLAARTYLGAEKAKQEEQAARTPRQDPSVLVRPDSPSLGPKDAKVTVVEFFDPECESCRAMHPLVKNIIKETGDRVRLVLRYMPLHPNSVYAASALEAAGEQGRYWDMLEALFQNQPIWGSHHAPRPELIPDYARQIGLDAAAFERSLTNGAHKAKVERDKADAQKLGVTGTPTFFVNGRPLHQLGYDTLKALIVEELARQP
jgi:protein-disulfide isomerase